MAAIYGDSNGISNHDALVESWFVLGTYPDGRVDVDGAIYGTVALHVTDAQAKHIIAARKRFLDELENALER